ncbi:expressed unknown protein [Seminavis robusta]|uniref:Uncharacterized protein n=1 Tax=Seminavis robusta TaxID=568900 RepID=A0A9N8E2U4_9STRA|nr:expressed unknown protein [Seminavis robusta]|eukprot:Sro561_g166770.1 n/a (419) ;mRNA; f:13848-15180
MISTIIKKTMMIRPFVAVMVALMATMTVADEAIRNRGIFSAPTTAEPTDSPSGGPSEVPSPTPTTDVSAAPTGTDNPPSICVATMDHSGKLCHAMMSEGDEAVEVATVCVEVVNGPEDVPQLSVAFTAAENYLLLTNKFWFGEDVTHVPRLSDGSADLDSFDYFFCNSTGLPIFGFEADFDDEEPLCPKGKTGMEEFSMIAYVEVAKIIPATGKPDLHHKIHAFAYEHSVGYASTWVGWFDFEIDCDCGKPTDRTVQPETCAGYPEVYLESPVSPACHAIVAGGDMQSMEAGKVCVEVIDEKLEVTFVSSDKWALIRSQLWVGRDTGEEDALTQMPKKKSGAPDTRKFKNYACDWEGEEKVSFTIDLKYECDLDKELVTFHVVAHSTVGQVQDGALIPGTELDVFAFEHSGDSEKWFV